MDYNSHKHKILGILVDEMGYFSHKLDPVHNVNIFVLLKKTKLSDRNIYITTSSLQNSGEVICHNYENYSITTIGIEAYANKKYIKAQRKRIIDMCKDIVGIFVPAASLVIAILALSIKNSGPSREDFKKLENRIKILERR